MSLHLQDLVDACKALAIAAKLHPTEEADWRYFCRQYSSAFSTPLHEVLLMDPEYVILNVFESQLDDVNAIENVEDLLEKIYAIEDPNYESEKERDLQDFIADAEAEEELRVKQGRPVHKAEANEPTLAPKSVLKETPKEGYVNLAYLAKQDKEE